METKFNAFEILQIAERVENRGANFYLASVERFADPDIRELYLHVANWKAGQEKAWAQLRKDLSERTGELGHYDPNDYVLSHPEVMAGLTWMIANPRRRLTGHEDRHQVINDCIRRENAVITFYQGLRDFIGDPMGFEIVDQLVAQEKRYVAALVNELNKQTC